MNPFLVSRNIGGFSVKPPVRAWARPGFLCGWAGSGQNQPITVEAFSFFLFQQSFRNLLKIVKKW
jgi:hypothetical protein